MNHFTSKNYFTDDELNCSCCDEAGFNADTLKRLNALRAFLGFALHMTSGYRCEDYNSAKGYTQTHATGQAADIACTHKQAYAIIKHAPTFGFTGIGIKQKGGGRFIHLEDLHETTGRPRPHIWSY